MADIGSGRNYTMCISVDNRKLHSNRTSVQNRICITVYSSDKYFLSGSNMAHNIYKKEKTRMIRRIALLLSTLLLISALCGCSPELHERLLVSAIGVDLVPNGWKITVLAYDPGEDNKEMSCTGFGNTIASALEEVKNKTGKTPMYSHCRMAVFGRKCAEYGLNSCIDFFVRHYDSRPNMKVLISDTAAETILSPENEKNSTEQIDLSLLTDIEKYSTSAASADLISLINGTFGSNKAADIPIVRRDENLTIIGSGLLQNMKLAKELNLDESRGMLLLSGKLNSGELTFNTENCGRISVYNRECLSSIKFTGSYESPQFEIDIRLKGEIGAIEHSMQPLSSDVFSEIEGAYANKAAALIEMYLKKAVIGNGADAAGLGNALMHENPQLWQNNQLNLSEYISNAEYRICVTAAIDRIEEEDVPYF